MNFIVSETKKTKLGFVLQTLVRSLLAEQLNSSEWSSRLSACNALSGLKGPIHKVLRP